MIIKLEVFSIDDLEAQCKSILRRIEFGITYKELKSQFAKGDFIKDEEVQHGS